MNVWRLRLLVVLFVQVVVAKTALAQPTAPDDDDAAAEGIDAALDDEQAKSTPAAMTQEAHWYSGRAGVVSLGLRAFAHLEGLNALLPGVAGYDATNVGVYLEGTASVVGAIDFDDALVAREAVGRERVPTKLPFSIAPTFNLDFASITRST